MLSYPLEAAIDRLHALDADERAVFAAVRALTEPRSVAERCEATLAAAESLFDASSAWILLHDAERDRLDVCVFRGRGADCYAGLAIPAGEGLVGRAARAREMLFVPDVARESGWYDVERMRRSGLRSALLVPLVFEDRAVGVLALDAPAFVRRPPTARDLARLDALAALAAIAIENASLYERSERDRSRLEAALSERERLRDQVQALQRQEAGGRARRAFVGSSAALTSALAELDVVAGVDTTVLLVGETGTGKELAARAIHEASRRAAGPFVAVNCGALPSALVESELFGHERGAFTGASWARPGRFELAHGGTLLLDEVGDLPLDAQVKLLRVLQDGRIDRVGGTRPIAVDVRIVAATNIDLERRLEEGTFRADLYYRLSVFPVRLPPLRERRDDIPLLASYFAHACAQRIGTSTAGFTPEALDALVRREWHGNVRELQNAVERAVLLSGGGAIGVDALRGPTWGNGGGSAMPAARTGAPPRTTHGTLQDTERAAILEALAATGWRISGTAGAAALLGMPPTSLHSRMKRLGIRRPVPTADRVGCDTA